MPLSLIGDLQCVIVVNGGCLYVGDKALILQGIVWLPGQAYSFDIDI